MKTPNYHIEKSINKLFIIIENKKHATRLADYLQDSQLFNIIEVTFPYKENKAKIKLYALEDKGNSEQTLYDMLDKYFIDIAE